MSKKTAETIVRKPTETPPEAAPAEESTDQVEVIKRKLADKKRRERTPMEKFLEFKSKTQTLLSEELGRFNLRIRDVGETEFIIYQGTMSNVWARFSVKEKVFYRTSLERQFEKAELIESSNDIVFRR